MSSKKRQEKDYREEHVSIAGFSESRRRDMLKNQKTVKTRQGWKFVSYHDNGMQSYAVFLAPKKKLPWKFITIGIIVIAALIVGTIFIPEQVRKSSKSATTESGSKASQSLKSKPPKASKKKQAPAKKEVREEKEQQKEKKKGNALLWQKATYEQKLATCKVLTKAMWQQKMFRKKIQQQIKTEADLQPYTEALLKALDKAFRRDPDPEKNRRMFENESISPTAVRLARYMGWLQ